MIGGDGENDFNFFGGGGVGESMVEVSKSSLSRKS